MSANIYHRFNEVLSDEQKEHLMRFDPCDDNSKQEDNSLAEFIKKYKEEHK